jgi:outer membrane immunogenic protein
MTKYKKNMKNLILVVAFVLISGLTFSQNRVVIQKNHTSSGANQLNLGVGLSEWGIPVYIGFDHFVSQDVTLGAEFSYRNYAKYYFYNDRYYGSNIMGFSGNANYHFNSVLNIPSNWDFYAGLNIGFYTYGNEPVGYNGTHTSGLGLGGQIGGRYYLSNKVGLNLEFGGTNAFRGGKFGLTIKI